MTETLTLTDFLLARIAEDEYWAKLADDVTDKVEDDWQDVTQPITHAMTQARPQEQWAKKYGYAYEHIARHDPARVLAECEAKRRIVEWHKAWPVLATTPPTFEPVDDGDPSSFAMRASQQMAWTTEQAYRDHFGTEPPTGPVLRFLALPYADHPDYREEWKP